MIQKLILLSLSLSICFSGGVAQEYPWVGFRFSQQWPAGFCNTTSQTCVLSKLVSNFTMRGLWAYDSNGDTLQDCDGTEFNISTISDFVDELNVEWPTYENYTNEEFWEYEWYLHGKCSESLLPQREYFETALIFKKQFDILGALGEAGITPNDEFYTVGSIIDAIKEKLGYTPSLFCRNNNLQEILLREVHLCVDQLGLNFIDCWVDNTGCGDETRKIKFISVSSALQNQVNRDVGYAGITQVAFELSKAQRHRLGNLARKFLV